VRIEFRTLNVSVSGINPEVKEQGTVIRKKEICCIEGCCYGAFLHREPFSGFLESGFPDSSTSLKNIHWVECVFIKNY